MDYDPDYWSKKRVEDHLYRREGTIMGDMARKQDESFRPPHSHIPSAQPNNQTTYKATRTKRIKKNSGLFPSVDRWFDNHLSQRMYRFISFVFMVVGTLLGISYAATLGIGAGLAAVLGGVAGFIVIPALIWSIKLVLLVLFLGLVGVALYVIYSVLLA